jgi:hypothetical protein
MSRRARLRRVAGSLAARSLVEIRSCIVTTRIDRLPMSQASVRSVIGSAPASTRI